MECQKDLFSIPEGTHYLNCAYKAPLLKSAEEAGLKALIRERNPASISSDIFFEDAEQVRQLFGELVGCHYSQVAIIPSTSYGFSSVLNNTPSKKNGNAITIKDAFPSGYFSLTRWCAENSNSLIVVEPTDPIKVGESWNANILSQISDTTSVVLLPHVHWMNGIRFDLETIGKKCKEVGAKLLVDGAQSVGALDIDVDKYHIDALICASYKWLFGPYSIAIAYISDFYKDGKPLEETWMNRTNAKDFSQLATYDSNYTPSAGRYNVGQSSHIITMPMLKASLTQVISWQPKYIQAYCKTLTEPLIEYLNSLSVSFEDKTYLSNHLCSLKLPLHINMQKLNENLKTHNVTVSMRGSNLRVSVNVFNDSKDIEKLIEVIEITSQQKAAQHVII